MKRGYQIRCTGLGVIPGLVFASPPPPEVLATWAERDRIHYGHLGIELKVWTEDAIIAGEGDEPVSPELLERVMSFREPKAPTSTTVDGITFAGTGTVEGP